VLQCVALYCSELPVLIKLGSPLLQCVAVCCSVLQCVVVCCSVLQCVAVWCIVVHCVAVVRRFFSDTSLFPLFFSLSLVTHLQAMRAHFGKFGFFFGVVTAAVKHNHADQAEEANDGFHFRFRCIFKYRTDSKLSIRTPEQHEIQSNIW